MNPQIQITGEDQSQLKFTISGVNVSIVNGIRRILHSNIPTVVFKTFPYSENKCDITKNTTRFNNEILKQRLSCIPIHITDLSIPLEQYRVEVSSKNESDMMEFVTTEDFKIINTTNDKEIAKSDRDKIFPQNKITGQYIDFCRLRPRLADNLEGEELEFTCTMEIGSALENSMYNVVSKAAYGNTLDPEAAHIAWTTKEQELQSSGVEGKELEDAKQNWYLLDAQRYFKPDSFDFVVESVGVYPNRDLMKLACTEMNKKLIKVNEQLEDGSLQVNEAVNTIENCYDIVLENEDYTIGKVIELILYTLHFQGDQTLSYCGFKKYHPHDTHSVIRIAFKSTTGENIKVYIAEYLRNALEKGIEIFRSISKAF